MENNTSVVSDVKADNPQQGGGFWFQVFDWLEVVVSAAIAVVLIFTFLFRVATVEGNSMLDTFYPNEKLIISNVFYTPKAGDVVIISRNIENSPSEDTDLPIIKRIIATENQTVDIDFDSGIVSVDGKPLDEPYTKTPTNAKYDIDFPVTVPEGCVFVMGDNRNISLDSRSSTIGDNGMIDTRYILGRVLLRVFPFDRVQGF